MAEKTLEAMGSAAKDALFLMSQASSAKKNSVLKTIATLLEEKSQDILKANLEDITSAKAMGLNHAMLDRLSMQGDRLQAIASDVLKIADLPDPIGEVFEEKALPNGLEICKCRTPIGVIGVIYEARPNVTVDVAAIVIKTGNCAILRGGKETLHSNQMLVSLIQNALALAELPSSAVQLIEDPDRSQVKELLRMHHAIDLIIPRGGAGLHQFCREHSSIPVITGGIGICHLFVDENVNIEKAIPVIHNAKTQRPTVCNALDTLLVHEKIAPQFLPKAMEMLTESQVALRLDPKAWKMLNLSFDNQSEYLQLAGSNDWDTEWLSLVLGIKVVANLDEAIAHIRKHSSGHSDGILTNDPSHAEKFVREIDSAAVYVNASTRFTDGGQFGLGAEVAISTQKLHARGPMGLRELTSYKWIVKGLYHIRS